MVAKLSARARRFLKTLERRPFVEDLDKVRAALLAAGVSITKPLLEFHKSFAGYVVPFWGEDGVLGLIHPNPKWLAPMQVEAFQDDEEELWLVACADVHPSWDAQIDQHGTIYANGPEATSCFMLTEQDAYVWEFGKSHPVEYIPLWLEDTPEHLNSVLLPRLAKLRISALSDEYCQFFASAEFIVTVKREDYYEAWVVKGATPKVFVGIPLWKE